MDNFLNYVMLQLKYLYIFIYVISGIILAAGILFLLYLRHK